MTAQPESTRYYPLSTSAAIVGLSTRRIRTYVQRGFVRPARLVGRQPQFGDRELADLRMLRRLSDDLGLNLAGIDVTLRLLDELARLRAARSEGDAPA